MAQPATPAKPLKLSQVMGGQPQDETPLELGVEPQARVSLPQQDITANSVIPGMSSGVDRTPMQKAAAEVAAGMGVVERTAAQYARGPVEIYQAVKQLGTNANAAFTPKADDSTLAASLKRGAAQALNLPAGHFEDTAQAEAAQLNADIAEDAQRYQAGLGKQPGGTLLPIAGQMVTTAPLASVTAPAKGAGVLASAGRSALTGGALAALTQPVTEGDDYWKSKAAQTAMGAGVGAGTDLGLRALGRGVEELATGKKVPRAILGMSKPDAMAEGNALAERTGIELTPGQRSGTTALDSAGKSTANKSLLMAENAARQSMWTANAVTATDRKIADQYAKRANELADAIGGSRDPAQAGTTIAATVKKATGLLEKARRTQADQDYGIVNRMTRGQASIDPSNANAYLRQLLEENEGAGGAQADAIAAWAKKQLGNVDPQLAAAAKKLGGSETQSAPSQGNLAKLLKLRQFMSKVSGGQQSLSGANEDKLIAAKMLSAIDQDLDDAAEQVGGDLGSALKLANTNYREASKKIDGVKNGPLGKLLGDDMVDHAGQGFNSVAPEELFNRFSKLQPSHMKVAVKLLSDHNPEALQNVRAAYIQRALDKAAPTAGGGIEQAPVRPSAFMNALAKDPAEKRKLAELFDRNQMAQIDDLFNAGRRIGDKTGYNTSGTDVRSETRSILGMLQNITVKAGASTGGQALGLRQVAKLMANPKGLEAMTQLRRLPAGSAKARQLTARIAAMLATEQNSERDTE